MKHLLASFLFILPALAIAQQRQPLNGKVTSDFDLPEGIYVINKTSEKSVTTARGGYFTIPATVGDTLIFSALQFKAIDMVLVKEDFEKPLLFVPLEVQNRNLDEVVIVSYPRINAEAMGLVPYGQKQYTPTERKLATASAWKMNPLGLDPFINAFSGRTAMLQRAADIEKKEDLMQKIDYIYTEDAIIEKLKIPADYVRGFVYYIVENKYFVKALAEKNKAMAEYLINGLAQKYLKLLNSDE